MKETLVELSKAEPENLKEGVIACASQCDKILRTLKTEKEEAEQELKASKADTAKLASEYALYEQLFDAGKIYITMLCVLNVHVKFVTS